jgi:proline-specific peptidase
MSKRTPFPITEGFIPFHGHRTWYRIVGNKEAPGKLPLICLHGGPGATHDYFGSLEAFAATGRRVVLYDQLGWGRSDHIRDPSLWTVDLFVDELKAVRKSLGLSRAHILGHSWGGMLALEYAFTRPRGLAGLVLANTLSSSTQWAREARRLIKQLPPDVQDAIHKNEAAGTTNSPGYRAAMKEYSRLHIGGHISPFPDWAKKAFKKIGTNEIYLTMWGSISC